MEEQPAFTPLETLDALQDHRLGSRGQAAHVANTLRLGGSAQLVQGLHAQLRVQLANRLRSEAVQVEHLQEAGRELGEELLAVLRSGGRRELGELVRDRLSHARDVGRSPFPVRPRDLDRVAPNGVGGAVVRHGLEPDLALDLQQVADVVEDLCELTVRQERDLAGLPDRAPLPVRLGRRLLVVLDGGVDVRLGRRCVGGPLHTGDGIEPPTSRAADQPAITRSRPARLARRRAWSARSTSASMGSSGPVAFATPTDTLTPGTPRSPRSSSRTASRTRSPTSRATAGPGFRSSTANSSPPMRAGTSSSRTAAVMAPATERSTWSPTGWP